MALSYCQLFSDKHLKSNEHVKYFNLQVHVMVTFQRTVGSSQSLRPAGLPLIVFAA